jgi:hypothetical protein
MEEQVFDEPILLYVNNNIICQRGFNIRDYDEKQMLLSLMRLDNFRV